MCLRYAQFFQIITHNFTKIVFLLYYGSIVRVKIIKKHLHSIV